MTRSFPVGALITQKKIGVQYMQHLGQWLHECIQLRSSTFQVSLVDFLFLLYGCVYLLGLYFLGTEIKAIFLL